MSLRDMMAGLLVISRQPARPGLLPLFLLLAPLCRHLPAQCTTEWATYGGVPGLDNVVNASTTWDPDGPGPAASVLVVGGLFTTAGNVVTQSIAQYDPQTRAFAAMGGPGLTGGGYNEVRALVTLPAGDVIAGGDFLRAGSTAVSNIARWDGTSWVPLGGGANGRVHALAALPNGDVIAGGDFTVAGGTAASFIARWDGTTWHPLGSGVNGSVTALCALPNGDVIAGGVFTVAGSTPASNVARWNGTVWSPLGTGLTTLSPESVCALAVMPSGDLIAGGDFYYAGSTIVSHLARWDGSSWTGFGLGTGSAVRALLVLPNGNLLVGGMFWTVNGAFLPGLARWNGAGWSALGAGLVGGSHIYSLTTLPNGNLFAGGGPDIVGGPVSKGGALWDGSSWHPLASGTAGVFDALAARTSGGVIAGGTFTMVAGVSASNVASFDGVAWSVLGAGTNGAVYAVAEMPNGDVVAGGGFTAAGGVTARGLARWDGASWHALGAGLTGYGTASPVVNACLAHSSGDLIVGGTFAMAGQTTVNHIARWDGTSWHALGAGVGGSSGAQMVTHLVELPNGDIVAGGPFFTAGGVNINGGLARWDGASWHAVGTGLGLSGPSALLASRNGDLVYGGLGWVGRWDGVAWQTLGSPPNGQIKALAELPNGDLIAGGSFSFSGSVLTSNIARWDGTSWSSIGTILGGWVLALEVLDGGVLEVSGAFAIAQGLAAASLAEWRTTCPAQAVPIPTICAGSAGPVALVAVALPWTGSVFVSEATGFSPNALAAVLVGITSPNQALTAWSPLAGAACLQLASLEAVLMVVPQGSTAGYSFAIPNVGSYTGLVLFHQYLQLELGGTQGALLTSSNGLRLTLGGF